MEVVIFLVEEIEDGGYIAKGMGVSIFTEAETTKELRISVKEAVQYHFEDNRPKKSYTLNNSTEWATSHYNSQS